MDNQQRQQLNELTISKANEEIRVIQEKTRSTEAPIKLHQLHKQTAYHVPATQPPTDRPKSNTAPLRIFVPDDDFKSVSSRGGSTTLQRTIFVYSRRLHYTEK